MKKFFAGCLICILFLFIIIPFGRENKDSDIPVNEAKVGRETGAVTGQSEESTIEESPVEVSLVMVGDMLMHDYVQTNGQYPDGTYNYDHLFAHVQPDIQDADVAVVNQEVIIGGDELGIQNYPRFNCRHEVGDALANAGFDVILHATNHTMDQGEKGVRNCMDFWDRNYPTIQYLGIHQDEQDYEEIYVYEKDGFEIAMLNYTYGLNGASLSGDNQYLIDLLDEDKVKEDLARAGELADLVVVFPHWGTEYSLEVSNEQEKWAQIFADGGADLVIGAHPHVIEPIRWVRGENGNETLVYYSIGNFVSAQDRAEAMLGAMAKVALQKDGDGHVSVKDYGAIPLVTHRQSGCASVTTYKLDEYTEELSQANRIRRNDASFSIEKMEGIWREVMGS